MADTRALYGAMRMLERVEPNMPAAFFSQATLLALHSRIESETSEDLAAFIYGHWVMEKRLRELRGDCTNPKHA